MYITSLGERGRVQQADCHTAHCVRCLKWEGQLITIPTDSLSCPVRWRYKVTTVHAVFSELSPNVAHVSTLSVDFICIVFPYALTWCLWGLYLLWWCYLLLFADVLECWSTAHCPMFYIGCVKTGFCSGLLLLSWANVDTGCRHPLNLDSLSFNPQQVWGFGHCWASLSQCPPQTKSTQSTRENLFLRVSCPILRWVSNHISQIKMFAFSLLVNNSCLISACSLQRHNPTTC